MSFAEVLFEIEILPYLEVVVNVGIVGDFRFEMNYFVIFVIFSSEKLLFFMPTNLNIT